MKAMLEGERPITQSEFDRALNEAWEHVSEARKATGFDHQKQLLWTGIKKMSINFINEDHYFGSIILKEEQIDIDNEKWWVNDLVLIGADQFGSKQWYPLVDSGQIKLELSDGLKEMTPINLVSFVQPDSPIGIYAKKTADKFGAKIPTYEELVGGEDYSPQSLAIKKIYDKNGRGRYA